MDPFSPRSPYKHPIGSGAVYAPIQSPMFIPGSLIGINVTAWTKNVWLASPTDPLTPLYHSNFPNPGDRTLQWTVRVPTNVFPSGGTDGHMMVVDQNKVWVYESSVVRAHTGAQGAGWRGEMWWRNNIRETGVYPVFHGSGASGNAQMGGLIRAGEPENGFHHALAATVSNGAYNGGPDGKTWPSGKPPAGPGHTWPSNSQDRNLGTSGNLYNGTLLAIPASVDIGSLGITDVRALNFARCMQDYGVYLTTSGNVFSGIVFNANGAEAAQLQFPARTNGADFSHPFWRGMSLATAQLRVVTNNRPTSIGGGSAPRVPMSAEFGP